MKKFKSTSIQILSRESKLLLFLFGLIIIGVISCSKDKLNDDSSTDFLKVEDPQFLLTSSELETEIDTYLKDESMKDDFESFHNNDCPTGFISIPQVDPGATAQFPFHGSTSITITFSRPGNCEFLRPCLFIGYVTITTLPGETGNYRVRQPLYNLPQNTANGISGSVNIPFGLAQLPLAIFCRDAARIVIEAQDPVTNTWHTVREFRLLCYPCSLDPIEF